MAEPGQPIFAPSPKRTTSLKGHGSSVFLHNLVRDQISLPTWLAIGGVLQAILLLLPIRRYLALAPAMIWILVTVGNEVLMLAGLRTDMYAARALKTKFTAVFPTGSSSTSSADSSLSIESRKAPGGGSMSLFIIGFSSNHPLGPLAPGYKEVVEWHTQMAAELAGQAESTGFLGSTPFFSAAGHTRNAGITTIYYFTDISKVREYATGPIHTKTMQWWVRHQRQYPWLGIMHELYQVEKGAWENIYINHEPVLFASTKHAVHSDAEGDTQWASPVVDARRGRLSTTQGRLGQAS